MRLVGKDPGDEGAMGARRIASIGHAAVSFSRDFADVSGGGIRVIDRDRPIDQRTRNFEPAAGACHQGREPGQI
jgi:hypothetical protein